MIIPSCDSRIFRVEDVELVGIAYTPYAHSAMRIDEWLQ